MTDADSTTSGTATATATATVAAPRRDAAANGRRRGPRILLLFAVIAVAVGVAWSLWTAGVESTDDAFVAADVYRVNARVPGRVARVLVRENETVAAGQLLAELESDDYGAHRAEAQARVALAEARARAAELDVGLVDAATASANAAATAGVAAARAKLERAQADLAAATAETERSSADRQRYEQLSEHAVSRQRLAAVVADATAAAATAEAAQRGVESARADLAAAEAEAARAEADRARVDVARAAAAERHAELDAARALLQRAEIDLLSTKLVAPAAGRVTRKAVLPGTWVKEGQELMALVGVDVWVVANFKETQLAHLERGQRARVHVDAYGLDLDGRVDSVQAGSGAAFSLLPPENATGNYVKVVQRVPVKILFDRQPDGRFTLGPGMSVVPEVFVR